MSDNGNQNALDLTGLWTGLYSYPRYMAPVTFTAQLVESGGWISGSSEEIATLPAFNGRTIAATLQGRRSGANVTFLKLYDEALAEYDAVAYEGAVNREGTEIAGRWSIPGSWSGTFLMTRPAGAHVPAERLATAKV